MKYSIKFFRNSRAIERASEVILKYDEEHESLAEYVKEYTKGQRIVLDICGLQLDTPLDKHCEHWAAARKEHNKLAIKLSEQQLEFIPRLKELNIEYFFSTVVDTLDKLSALILLGTSDVYICNELGFSLKTIAPYCHSKSVNVRVYPNVAQSSSDSKKVDGFKKFFIRPEDIDVYEDYVDYCEFYGDALDKQDVLFEIYKDKRWLGELSWLILGLDIDHIHNPSILPDFASRRVNCGKRCAYGKCEMCDNVLYFIDLSKSIEEESGQRLEFRRQNDRKSEPESDEGLDDNDGGETL